MKKYLAGFSVFALIACAPPTQFLVRKYTPSQLDNKSLVIYPVASNQIDIINTEDFTDDFEDVESDPSDFMRQEINRDAAAFFESGFKYVQVINGADSNLAPLTTSNSEKLTEKIRSDVFEIRIPTFSHLEKHGLQPKFVLVFDQIHFSRNLKTAQQTLHSAPVPVNHGGQMANAGPQPMMVTTTQKSIGMGMNYLLYDYEEKAVVGYGFASGEKTFSFAMTRSDWYAAMKNAFGAVKKFSPFK